MHFFLYHLRREAHHLHKILLAKLTCYGPENTRSDRCSIILDKHGRILVKTNVSPVFTTDFLPRPNDYGIINLALLRRSVR